VRRNTHTATRSHIGPPTFRADKKLNQRKIQATDAETDALVYELYGLTEEQIAIVEARDR